jgi:pimeloyl-ACP methyl ester carboxylesterase
MKPNLARAGPRCQPLKILPATGHTLNLEKPAAFHRHVREFLGTVSAGRVSEVARTRG